MDVNILVAVAMVVISMLGVAILVAFLRKLKCCEDTEVLLI